MNLRPANLLHKYLHFIQFDMHKSMMEYKLKTLSSSFKGTWLDIGAGHQPYKQFFSEADSYLTTNTKRHYSENEIENLKQLTTYWIEDGKNLPLADCSVDGVACFQVLSVIEKPDAFFAEINRIMKPGGKIVLTTDFLYPVWSCEDRLRHTAFSLSELCKTNGFSNIKIESFGGFSSLVFSLFMRYMRSFPDIWKKKATAAKAITIIVYLILLLLLPVASAKGYFIYLLERNNKSNTAFTFNLLLRAEKSS